MKPDTQNNTKPAFRYSKWMSKLHPSTTLRSLILPGSHDANTYNLKKPRLAVPFAKTQVLPISTQLEWGVRFLDIRYTRGCKKKSKKLADLFAAGAPNWNLLFQEAAPTILNGHGVTYGESFFDMLMDIADFAKKNPTEFIIIKTQQEKNKLTGFQKRVLVEFIRSIFGKLLVNDIDLNTWFKIPSVTIRDVWDNKKNVFFIIKEEIYTDLWIADAPAIEGGKLITGNTKEPLPPVGIGYGNWDEIGRAVNYLDQVGVFDYRRFLYSPWFNTDKFSKLKEGMVEVKDAHQPDKFKAFQMIFSPQGGFAFIFTLPTIYKLEKNQFLKNSQCENLMVEFIVHNADVNVGKTFFAM